jgi:hypothetical protein
LAITPAAPSDRNRSSSLAWARAVMKTTGTAAVCGRSRRRASVIGPSMSGIMTSSRIRSGAQLVVAVSASPPDAQLRTANAGSRPSDISTTSRMSGSSST